MVHPTIVAAAVAVAVCRIRGGDPHESWRRAVLSVASAVQEGLHWLQREAARRWRTFYNTHRSAISLTIGVLFRYPDPFECDCCCLRLGRQDLDVFYHASCRCRESQDAQFCFQCICTFVESQVTDMQATRVRCMSSRRCELDDRFVRKRLSSKTAIQILDRNQVIQASVAELKKEECKEKLWYCPSPDCFYIGYISKNTRQAPTKRSIFDAFRRPDPDPRSVRCPWCLICSCQFCSRVWSRGTHDHAGLTCETYAAKLESMPNDEGQLLDEWRSSHNVRSCQQCRATIEKSDGCKHMTCRCRYEFCWVCGKEWAVGHLQVPCQAPRLQQRVDTSSGEPLSRRAVAWLTWLVGS